MRYGYQADLMVWIGIGILGLGALLLLVSILILRKRLRRFESAYLVLQTTLSGKNLDQMLEQYVHQVQDLATRLRLMEGRVERAENALKHTVDRVELLRYNAFDNMGSDLSFALAFLNQEGDGVILSSIHSREESRTYAKPVLKGGSKYNLSKEEEETITKALAKPKSIQ